MSITRFDKGIAGNADQALDLIRNILESSTAYSIIGKDLDGKIAPLARGRTPALRLAVDRHRLPLLDRLANSRPAAWTRPRRCSLSDPPD